MTTKCEVTKFGVVCGGPVYCTFRRRMYGDGHVYYKNIPVCEDHAKNHSRLTDVYEQVFRDTNGKRSSYSGENSPYWEYQENQQNEEEIARANPDILGDNAPNPWKSEEMCLENETLVNAVKTNLDKLSFREGQILQLLCYKGMSQSEISRFLNINRQAVSTYIKRIKNKFKGLLDI